MSDSILGANNDASARQLAVYFTARSAESRGGARYVTDKAINNWYKHRDRNGFPEEESEKRPVKGARPARVWNVERAWQWFKNYEPSRGGAPKGNRNAVRHGRCVGVRAAREARLAARSGL